MAFKLAGTLDPHGGPVLRSMIAANSITVAELRSVKMASGFAALGTTGALVFGHVKAVQTNEGIGLNTTGVAGAAIGTFVGTYATASDNQTVAKVRVACDVSKTTLYSADTDATIGTTTGSNLAGYTLDLTDSTQLSESSALTTTGRYMGWGLDPTDSTNAIVNIYESQVFGV